MNLGLGPLFRRLECEPPERCVLATVVDTQGSSYRKPGAMMLLCDPSPPVGLVSGGCLEADLAEHARSVLAEGRSRRVTYDLSRDDDALWGLGIGCGGRIAVLLEPVATDDGYGGLAGVAEHWRAGRFCWLAKRVDESDVVGAERYAVVADGDPLPERFGVADLAAADRTRATPLADDVLLVPVNPPPGLLVCGAGPDAVPLVRFAAECGWHVQVIDHRPAHARPEAFPAAATVTCSPIGEFGAVLAGCRVDAAVVMSHHLENDAHYARELSGSAARYIGILGPALRRDEVLARAGVDDDARYCGPAGLDIGADLPESIALSILAQAHAVLCDREGGPIRGRD